MPPNRLEIICRINVVEDDDLRARQLAAIVQLLRSADELQRTDRNRETR
jgi:hypothetical protein